MKQTPHGNRKQQIDSAGQSWRLTQDFNYYWIGINEDTVNTDSTIGINDRAIRRQALPTHRNAPGARGKEFTNYPAQVNGLNGIEIIVNIKCDAWTREFGKAGGTSDSAVISLQFLDFTLTIIDCFLIAGIRSNLSDSVFHH